MRNIPPGRRRRHLTPSSPSDSAEMHIECESRNLDQLIAHFPLEEHGQHSLVMFSSLTRSLPTVWLAKHTFPIIPVGCDWLMGLEAEVVQQIARASGPFYFAARGRLMSEGAGPSAKHEQQC
ncbi:unnamed protein product [Pleuronectes platessa]|uniref:Uncharacterized protein n=1 Tax=Pleuronectes platessa TaxID=8262 RepID=A0A9N7Z531_PLEPL|nr:unnamed protein product [Pleuronectes platessa]